MSSDPYEDRRKLTFEQAEGAERLPTQLQTKELSKELRLGCGLLCMNCSNRIRNMQISQGLTLALDKKILYDFHVLRQSRPADEFQNNATKLTNEIKKIFMQEDYTRVFGFLQFVLRRRSCPHNFAGNVQWALTDGHAAYRILDRSTIVPIGSEEEEQALQRAFADLAKSEFDGARFHLRLAAECLTNGRYADSVRESVHCVESVARTLVEWAS